MKRNKTWNWGLASAAGTLTLLAALLLTGCDNLTGGTSQRTSRSETEQEAEQKSSLPPIGSVVARNVLTERAEREADEAAEIEDVLPLLGTPFTSEKGAVWTFQDSDEEGVLNATLTDPDRGKGKLQNYELRQYASCAYDVYPKGRDISISIIRIKDNGATVEEARGGSRTLFVADQD